jgi:RNA polymerase sigma-70 factor (ECF subfamily)
MSEAEAEADPPADPGIWQPEDRFDATRWSVVIAARDEDPDLAREALAVLCRAYWFPIYAFIRRRGYEPDRAADLTQGFFARLIEAGSLRAADPARGRFRSFLLASCVNFLANEREREQALKRGGGRPPVSIDALDAEQRYQVEPAHDETPERLFLRRWALSLIDEALDRLRLVERDAGRGRPFDHLRPALAPGPEGPPSSAELADRLGTNPHAAEMALHRLRRRFGQILRAAIVETLADPSQLDDEIRDLFDALRP